jgi:hypothetical protein
MRSGGNGLTCLVWTIHETFPLPPLACVDGVREWPLELLQQLNLSDKSKYSPSALTVMESSRTFSASIYPMGDLLVA